MIGYCGGLTGVPNIQLLYNGIVIRQGSDARLGWSDVVESDDPEAPRSGGNGRSVSWVSRLVGTRLFSAEDLPKLRSLWLKGGLIDHL